MIISKVPELRFEKERREKRKLPIRVISEETGLSAGAIHRLLQEDVERVDTATLNTLCGYFECGVGDLLQYVKEGSGQ